MKKFCALILALAMVISVSACGGQQDSSTHYSESSAVDTSVLAPCNASECIGNVLADVEEVFYNAGFMNITAEKVEDLKSSEANMANTTISISIDGQTDFVKGQEFDKDDEVLIIYHGFQKCNVTMHVDFPSNLLFSKYDVTLNMDGVPQGTMKHGESKDFEFKVEPEEYTFTFEEDGDSSVNGSTVLDVKGDIEISLRISCHNDKIDIETLYIEDKGALEENEVMIPSDCIEFHGKNFEDYANALKESGFTNIALEAIYDIASGESGIGEIENVTIGGISEFSRGDIFTNDVAVIITYHENEADDPAVKEQTAKESALEAVFPKELARRAVIVAMTNGQASDVFSEDGYSYDAAKFHTYSDIDGFFMIVDTDGTWTALDDRTWHVEGIILEIFDYGTFLKATCNIKKDGDTYIVSNVDRTIAKREYIDSEDPSKINTEHLDPSEHNPFLTVPGELINEDRDAESLRDKMTAKAKDQAAYEERQHWIENQFHWFDGRHIKLSELIKDNLNDSASFKAGNASYIDVNDEELQAIVNQTLEEMGSSARVEVGDLLIIQEFTAKNVFNATVKNTAYGIVRGSDGTVILIGIE